MFKKINRLPPIFLLLVLGFIWGTGYSIARFAMTNGVNALGYSFWQSLGPALALSFIAILASPKSIRLRSNHWRYYFICGLSGIVIPNTTMYFAAAHLPAGLLAVIVNTMPLFAYVIALMTGAEIFNSLRLCAVALGMTGLMLILLPAANLNAAELPWLAAALLTPLSFAFCAVYVSRYQPAGVNPIASAAGTLIFSSLLLAPLTLGSGGFYALHWPLTLPDSAIVLEIILSSLGYILFFQLLKTAGPVYYSFVDTIVALTGLFWGWAVFGEQLTALTGSGVALVLLALVLVNKRLQNMLEYPASFP